MKILQKSTIEQVLKFLPTTRGVDFRFEIVDELTLNVISLTLDIWNFVEQTWDEYNSNWEGFADEGYVGDYYRFTAEYDLIEGRTYDFYAYVDNELMYVDKIFCTNQVIDQDTNNYFSLNNGLYLYFAGSNDVAYNSYNDGAYQYFTSPQTIEYNQYNDFNYIYFNNPDIRTYDSYEQ